jgi:transposase
MIDMTELMGIVFSGLSALVIEDVEDAGEVIVVRARTRSGDVSCPGCGSGTSRVHGYHERTAADVPADGRRVVVKVRARRLRCPALGCTVQTFREQVPGVLERYQRRISRLTAQEHPQALPFLIGQGMAIQAIRHRTGLHHPPRRSTGRALAVPVLARWRCR